MDDNLLNLPAAKRFLEGLDGIIETAGNSEESLFKMKQEKWMWL